MHPGKGGFNSISKRTRSQLDVFYRNCHQEIKKKRRQEVSIHNNINGSGNLKDDDHDSKSSASQKSENFNVGDYNKNAAVFIDSEEISNSEDDDDEDYKHRISKKSQKNGNRKPGMSKKQCNDDTVGRRKPGRPAKKKAHLGGKFDVIETLMDSMLKENEKEPVLVKVKSMNRNTLPLRFKFEDGSSVPDKTDEEKEIDSLFQELERGLWECGIGFTNCSMVDDEETISVDNDESLVASCGRGEHNVILDEQIGVKCTYCSHVLLHIKDVLPEFYVEPLKIREWRDSNKSQNSITDQIQFQSTAFDNIKSSVYSKGTVFDLIPKSDKELYPHQQEGLEFMWKNIVGDININNLKDADHGGGCIISHAPGTGKTRLAIVFLQTFIKLYPNCHPVIIAPRGMLLTWEQEFQKWKVELKFHNLNENKLSDMDKEIAKSVVGITQFNEKDKDIIRLVKLCSWKKGGSILGISYRLFERLAGEGKGKETSDYYRKILWELPGLLVLDEGHTPRNNQSQVWKALTKVKTQRRVILSGTPFQNNFSELYNTLCLVNPKFSHQSVATQGRKRKEDEWSYLTSSISKNNSKKEDVKKLQLMMEPFVHIHKGGILQKTLPGMKDCLILLRPTDFQKELLEKISKVEKFLDQVHLASLISVHPSLASKNQAFSVYKKKLDKLELDSNAGVKTQFLIELIRLSDRLGEKILVFSQFIDPLIHIKKLLKLHFSWNEGQEVVYMDGDLSLKERQSSINSFNDKSKKTKVMLASQRACSEGIHLVGASRVVLLDVVWNPSVERQAISRAYRIGQERIVYVYHLVTMMELKKYERQTEKERISELIFSKGGGGKIMSSSCKLEEDKVLEAMVGHKSLSGIFERIVHQPKESDLVDSFVFVDKGGCLV